MRAAGAGSTEASPPVASATIEPAHEVARTEPALATALRALRPEIELVPEICGPGGTAARRGHVCAREGRRTRAVRRFSLARVPHVRVGDGVLALVDHAGERTRVPSGLVRWDLRTDLTERLESPTQVTSLIDLGFGALVGYEAGQGITRALLERPDAPPMEVPADRLEQTFHVVDGTTYAFRTQGSELAVTRLTVSAEALVEEPVTVVPGAVWWDDTNVTAWIVHVDGTRLQLRRAPFTEVSTVELRVRPGPITEIEGGWWIGYGRGQRVRVELASGAVTREPASSDIVIAPEPGPGSLHEVVLAAGGVFVRAQQASLLLTAAGADAVEATPAQEPAACACEGDALACGDRRIEAACLEVEGLEQLRVVGAVAPPSTQLGPDGRFRVDMIEADLARVTRLSDGARLWLWISTEALVVQADDGAFWASQPELTPSHTVRRGRSILDAPVRALEEERAALFRPTLIRAFFAGEPLPAAG